MSVDLTGATVIHVQPGDKLILAVRGQRSERERDHICEVLTEFFGGVEAMVITEVDSVIIQKAADRPCTCRKIDVTVNYSEPEYVRGIPAFDCPQHGDAWKEQQ